MEATMEPFVDWRDAAGSDPDRFFKTTLFRSDRLLLGLNCLEPGQVQPVHTHEDQDKFYHVLEGEADVVVGGQTRRCGVGITVWAPTGEPHGVSNRGEERLTLLVGIAPAPARSV
jgi:mannose-6-phosphate isomerase-like protein (cupin superfamily)